MLVSFRPLNFVGEYGGSKGYMPSHKLNSLFVKGGVSLSRESVIMDSFQRPSLSYWG